MIGAQIVFAGMHHGRLLLGNCGADRIGPLALFRPGDARTQGNAIGFFEEIVVAQRMHDHSVRIGQ